MTLQHLRPHLCSAFQCAPYVTAAAPHSFDCPSAGVFPDPKDCHNYYICDSSLVPHLGICMSGIGTYDADAKVCRTTPCSGPPAVAAATPAPFVCPAVGLFADPTSCHNYYTCDQDLKAIPGACMKGNGTFDPVTQVCITAPCPVSLTFVCPSSGIFADPQDCHGFYVCDENLNPVQSSCTSYAHYDPRSICVIGPCGQSTSGAFKCNDYGYFADPTDCRSYYFCDASLTATHRTCMGGGGYFDAESQGCFFGSC